MMVKELPQEMFQDSEESDEDMDIEPVLKKTKV